MIGRGAESPTELQQPQQRGSPLFCEYHRHNFGSLARVGLSSTTGFLIDIYDTHTCQVVFFDCSAGYRFHQEGYFHNQGVRLYSLEAERRQKRRSQILGLSWCDSPSSKGHRSETLISDKASILDQAWFLDQVRRDERGPLHGAAIAIKEARSTKGAVVPSYGNCCNLAN